MTSTVSTRCGSISRTSKIYGFVTVALVEENDFGARRHDVAHRQGFEHEHAFHHFGFGLLKHSGAQPFLHEHLDFLLCDRWVLGGLESEHPEQSVGRMTKELYDRPGQNGELLHWPSHGHGNAFRVVQSDAFRRRFTQHE